MAEFASKGVGTAGLTTGIIGAVGFANQMGLLGGCGNGGGLFSNRNCGCDPYITRYEAQKDSEIAQKDTRIALLEANIYSDQKTIEVFTSLSNRIKDLENIVNSTVCSQAVTNQKLSDNITFVDSKFEGVYKDMACGYEKLKCYADATFVPGKLVMPLDSICPEPMERYNSWTAPTTPATTSTVKTNTTF